MIISFYVSGHGFGHATRACKVISALLSLPQRHVVHVVSLAPDFIFVEELQDYPRGANKFNSPKARWYYRNACVEPAVVQPKAYTVDRETTVQNLKTFIQNHDCIIEQEVNWLKEVSADVVVVDAPFLPCAAAKVAGIPSVIVTNFTFDAVYEGIMSSCPTSEATDDSLDLQIQECLRTVKADYSTASALICLQGHAPGLIPTFDGGDIMLLNSVVAQGEDTLRLKDPSRIVMRAPLMARYAKKAREVVLKELHVPPDDLDKKVLLISFGGQSLAQRTPPSIPDGWIALVCGDAVACSSTDQRFYPVPKSAYIPDVINASDIVLGKLGYGTVSECLIHEKPFLYVPRTQFIEEKGLVRLLMSREQIKNMKSPQMCTEVPRDHFEKGQWKDYIFDLQESSVIFAQECAALGRDITGADDRKESLQAHMTIARMLVDFVTRFRLSGLSNNLQAPLPQILNNTKAPKKGSNEQLLRTQIAAQLETLDFRFNRLLNCRPQIKSLNQSQSECANRWEQKVTSTREKVTVLEAMQKSYLGLVERLQLHIAEHNSRAEELLNQVKKLETEEDEILNTMDLPRQSGALAPTRRQHRGQSIWHRVVGVLAPETRQHHRQSMWDRAVLRLSLKPTSSVVTYPKNLNATVFDKDDAITGTTTELLVDNNLDIFKEATSIMEDVITSIRTKHPGMWRFSLILAVLAYIVLRAYHSTAKTIIMDNDSHPWEIYQMERQEGMEADFPEGVE